MVNGALARSRITATILHFFSVVKATQAGAIMTMAQHQQSSSSLAFIGRACSALWLNLFLIEF